MGKKASYVAIPAVPEALLQRLVVVVRVMSGLQSVSDGARTLGLSRNHFQTVLHRGLEGLIRGLEMKPAGRRARPAGQAALERELKRLTRQNARLEKRVAATEQLLTVASGLLHGRVRPRPSLRRTKASRDEGSEDPDPARRKVLAGVETMRALGVNAALAAAVAGVHPATVRRWRVRARNPAPVSRVRPVRCVPTEVVAQASTLVRSLRGQIGVEALRHAVPALTRRQAAWLKAEVLTRLERERKAGLVRVEVTQPGVLRAMDGVHYRAARGPLWALIAADGAVPYRTSVAVGRHYDAGLVARALAADLECHGAPIVYRLDRAKAHAAPQVRSVLARYEVLVLHGPPRCPRYYGQLERQNREHRAWDDALRGLDDDEAASCLQEMLEVVNERWPRRMLGWRTASQAWNARVPLDVDRRALCDEVNERATHIACSLAGRGQPADLAERLAIEQALEARGYLRRQRGGWC
jgi:hypothetical protein